MTNSFPTLRYRLPELLVEKRVSAYSVVKASGGRISLATIYRLKRKRGRIDFFNAVVTRALCDTLHVSLGELMVPADAIGDAEGEGRAETPDHENASVVALGQGGASRAVVAGMESGVAACTLVDGAAVTVVG